MGAAAGEAGPRHAAAAPPYAGCETAWAGVSSTEPQRGWPARAGALVPDGKCFWGPPRKGRGAVSASLCKQTIASFVWREEREAVSERERARERESERASGRGRAYMSGRSYASNRVVEGVSMST